MKMNDVQKNFVAQWGEMGSRWGINRSVAAVHGILYLNPDPMTADDICETLSMARSNVSQALKELEAWELVYRESRAGERKSYYRCQSDVWEMARCIMKERKKREAEGALRTVNECLEMAREQQDQFLIERLASMQEILQMGCDFADRALKWPKSLFVKTLKMSGKLFDLLSRL